MSFKRFLQNIITSHKFIIDLNEYSKSIAENDQIDLLEFVQQNHHIGYVIFKPEDYQCSSKIKTEIEQQLEKNNSNFRPFTSDKIICLLAKITFNWHGNPYSEEYNHKLKEDWRQLEKQGWVMEKEFRQSQGISILYVNHRYRQAVLSFQGIKITQEDFFDGDRVNQAIVDSMLDSALAIRVLNETIEFIGNLNYFISFTGYAFGALIAEQSLLLSRKLKPELTNIQCVTFDSPGSLELLAYVCKDFNLSATLNDLKALNIVTYISSPNFVNSFGNHVGQIKYLYKHEDDLIELQTQMTQNNTLFYHISSLCSLLCNNLNDLCTDLNDESSLVVLLTDQKSDISIKEKNKKDLTELTKELLEMCPKYSYFFVTLVFNILSKTKSEPEKVFNARDYKLFIICENNEHESVLCTENKYSIDHLLNELNDSDIDLQIKSCQPELISLLKQISLLKSKFKVKYENNQVIIQLITNDLSVEDIKRRYQRLTHIEQFLKSKTNFNFSATNAEFSSFESEKVNQLIENASNFEKYVLSLRNEDENSRISKIEEIINGCYQNEDDLAYYMHDLSLSLTDYSLPPENKKSDRAGFFLDPSIKTRAFDLPLFPPDKHIYWKQGFLGDCWAIASFNIFVSNEKYFPKVIKKKNIDGSIEVRLLINGIEKTQKVDPIFPVDESGRPLYASSNDSIFAPVIEKAMAMANGSYTSLADGFMSEAYEMLTGKPSEFIQFRDPKFKSDEFWCKIIEYSKNRYPGGCSIGSVNPENDPSHIGLRTCHVYSIMKVKQLEDKTRLLQLRNPHATRSGTGDWSGKEIHQRWTAENLKEIDSDEDQIKTNHQQGIFWIQYEDFLKYFTRAFFCIDDQALNEHREAGFKIKSTEQTSFELSVKTKGVYYIKVYCDRERDGAKDSDLSLVLLEDKTSSNTSIKDKNHTLKDRTFPFNVLTSEICINLDPRRYRIVPLSFKDYYNRGLKKEDLKLYNLVIHSRQKIMLTKETKLDWVSTVCIHNICLLDSFTNNKFSNWATRSHNIFKIISPKDAKEGKAFILTSKLEHDVLFITAYNRNLHNMLHIKLNVKPNTYICKAALKNNKNSKIQFNVVEKLNISYLEKHVDTNLLNVDCKIAANDDKILCIIHRYIESPISVFERYCTDLSLNFKDYEVQKYTNNKDFIIKLEKTDFTK